MKKNISLVKIIPFTLLLGVLIVLQLFPDINYSTKYILIGSIFILSIISLVQILKIEKSKEKKKSKIVFLIIGVILSIIIFLQFY